jgi:hypothetical protein
MNKSLTRAVSLFAIITILVVPYFNCGAPSNNSIFNNSLDPDDCAASPQATLNCAAKVGFGPLPTVIQVPGGSGRVQVNGTCETGGFPKVLISPKIVYTANPINPVATTPDVFRCDMGIFYASIDLPASITWTDFSLTLILTMYAYKTDNDIEKVQLPHGTANISLRK